MARADEDELVRQSAARLYGDGQPIWKASDRWNARKRAAIDQFARRHAQEHLDGARFVLDAGCGCEPYDWLPRNTVSFDRFWKQTRQRSWPAAGDLTRLPFRTSSIDVAVCVASVLNYVPAAEALSELARATRPGGHLLLHFETSTSLEQFGRRNWGALATRLETLNSGREDTLWIYRPSYVRTLLTSLGFEIQRQQSFHILSALGLRIGLGQQSAARLAIFDAMLAPLGDLADDVILLAEKRA
ncbi:methyltransferase domain-containing protein [Bosea sp. (in: a-proteobacteria)]|uniref:methyltransferase domain-containing protein n=1 Tax=Bosea sp. (in: a-proteobacteria) TaxID=1871050 RepID=UPI001219A806|nr:methyltransferase domain-containing protein [Bosea sp. (in: a-proteobacteria)]TAJ33645.1 MAG: methyltransferase domain-containing protein [Bosea sp. (in: a-proteobacteria)]